MQGNDFISKRLPIAVRNIISTNETICKNPDLPVIVLGSFWPNSQSSFESHIVKSFKECYPVSSFEPHISRLCGFYADKILEATNDTKIDWIIRVLSSSEKQPEPMRPQSLIIKILCQKTGARDASSLFYKSEIRPPMRSIQRLSGQDAFLSRLQYVAQDLFVKPIKLEGNVLLLDDIMNTGASTQLYSEAIRKHLDVRNLIILNMAVTRFNRGKDGWGFLKLDMAGYPESDDFKQAWLDSDNIYHTEKDCPASKKPARCWLAFVARNKGRACDRCVQITPPLRKWWHIF